MSVWGIPVTPRRYRDIVGGRLNFVLCFSRHDWAVGDELSLEYYDPDTDVTYKARAGLTYIYVGDDVPEGVTLLGFELIEEDPSDQWFDLSSL